MNISPSFTIETDRLILRPFDRDDIDRMAQLLADPGFMRFSSGLYNKEKTVTFIEKIIRWAEAGKPSMLAATLKPDGRLLGYCGFFHHPDEGIEDVEIGYRLDPEYWNRGLITEGARAVRDHAFRDWDLPRVISLVHPENGPSRRVAEKNGMVVEREITFRTFPALVYAITREQWLRGIGNSDRPSSPDASTGSA